MSTTSPRSRWTTLAPAALLLWPALATAVLEIPDSPLFLTSTGVTPNIVVTLDDSGSMAWGYIPDGLSRTTRYAKSPYNPVYYNPEKTYRIPPDINGNNVAAPTFGAAFLNGFHTGRGTVNLATTYRPTSEFLPSTGGHTYMDHYSTATSGSGISDPIKPGTTHTDVGSMIGANSGSNAPYFVINDFADVDVSVSGSDPGTNIVSVWIGGQFTQAQYDGTFTGTCDNSKDPGSVNRYKTKVSGSTLTLCFRDDNAMYGKQVTITHQKAGGVAGYVPVRPTANAVAYYYVFDATNPIDNTGSPLCDPTNATRQTDNDCYDLRIVGQQAGPTDLDKDGDVDGEDEKQNFANWYSFYRIRNLMTISAAAFAFRTVPETSRIAWQSINSCRKDADELVTSSCKGWDTSAAGVSNAIKPFTSTHRTNFYNWLFRLPASGGTPLLNAMERVGLYYKTSKSGSPYDDDLTDTTKNHESTCRRNFHILMTDGVWNSNVAFTATYGNVDNTERELPDGTDYNPQPPFSDANDTALADIAFAYWSQDLRTDLADAVPSYVTDFEGEVTERYFNPKNNPASWQHLVNFNVGLGLSGFLKGPSPALTWAGDTYTGSYAGLAAGTLSWPATGESAIPGNVADLWHAALNSRGKFYSAENPDDLIAAFQDIMDSITTQAASGGGAGLSSNTSQIDQEGALIFEAKFNADWSGQLLARPVDDQFQLEEPLWDAGQRIPAPYDRRIFTLNGEPLAIRLEATCPGGPLQTALDKNAIGDTDGLCAQRVNWFRGDGRVEDAQAGWKDGDPLSGKVILTFEVRDHGYVVNDKLIVDGVTVSTVPEPDVGFNSPVSGFTVTATTPNTFSIEIAATELPGTYAGGGRARYADLRNRPISALGDIMNSDPVYSYGEDFGYGGGSSAVAGKDDYASFVSAKEADPPVLYVGANDGMLHAIRADSTGTDAGRELFAYIPQGVYANLSALTDPQYSHKYYVDGQLSVSDAYLGSAWGTYLVGTLGAGGKSVYALDVSDPANFAPTDVKWEFTEPTDLGFGFSKPQIAPMSFNQWGVVFGNGYNSPSDTAVLFVLDLADGSEIARVPTSGETANGLSTPYLYDSDGDTIVDVAYAGDLRGNLWKFVNTGGAWGLGNGHLPLFIARNAQDEVQPITVQPTVAVHEQGGVLIYFGTGSYLTHCDIGNPVGCTGTYDDQQTFYAIWDKEGTLGTVARSDLESYRILVEKTAFDRQVRTTSEGTVNWVTDRGWYLDLPKTPNTPAERVVAPAVALDFDTPSVPDRILFVTNIPSSDPCTMGGTTWLMELSLMTGGRTATSVFDLDGSGNFGSEDLVDGVPVSGVALDESWGITGEPLILTTEKGDIVKAFSGTTGKSGTDATPLQQGDPPGPGVGGAAPIRIYWRQIQ